jgi:hypothetical protein
MQSLYNVIITIGLEKEINVSDQFIFQKELDRLNQEKIAFEADKAKHIISLSKKYIREQTGMSLIQAVNNFFQRIYKLGFQGGYGHAIDFPESFSAVDGNEKFTTTTPCEILACELIGFRLTISPVARSEHWGN